MSKLEMDEYLKEMYLSKNNDNVTLKLTGYSQTLIRRDRRLTA